MCIVKIHWLLQEILFPKKLHNILALFIFRLFVIYMFVYRRAYMSNSEPVVKFLTDSVLAFHPPEKGENLNNSCLDSVMRHIFSWDMAYHPTIYILKHNHIYDKSYFLVLRCCRSLLLSGHLEWRL